MRTFISLVENKEYRYLLFNKVKGHRVANTVFDTQANRTHPDFTIS